jgi:cell wall-associated NlpC family hydrolase
MKYEHLLGVPYHVKTANCLTLVKQFYAENWGIIIRDYAFPDLWWMTDPKLNLLMRHARDEGFEMFDYNPREMRPGDGLLMAIGCSVVNHCGVYLGGGRFLHRPFRASSRVDLFAGAWRERCMTAVRHPQVVLPSAKSLELLDLLPPAKKEAYLEALERARLQAELVSRPAGGASGSGPG